MNERMSDELVQQLVDGELSHAERRALLMQADDNPVEWRRLALAFVEAQIWDESIPSARESAEVAQVELPTKSVAGKSHRSRLSMVAISTLLLLIALGIGYGVGRVVPTINHVATEVLETEPPHVRAALGDEPAGLRFEDAIARSSTPVPASFRQRLLQSGYLLDESHTLTSVTLPTGESVEIPVRNVSVQYLGNAAYQ